MIADIADLTGPTLECDVCIVGSGVIGLAMARALLGSGIRVTVLEAGPATFDAASQSAYEPDSVEGNFGGAVDGRRRQLGGTSNSWGGQALPLDPIDFEKRDWVPHSGWPIGPEVITPWLDRAADYMGIDTLDFDRDVFDRFGIERERFDPAQFRYHISKWAPDPRMIVRHRPALAASASLRILYRAAVTDIALNDAGDRIEQVVARAPDGANVTVRARHFVIATGAIETARLLLAAERRAGRAIGAGSRHVGRYLMDHPSGHIGQLDSRDPRATQRWFNMFYLDKRKFSVRLSLAEAEQRAARMLNASCGFNFILPPGSPVSALRDAKQALGERRYRAALAAIARSVPGIAGLASTAKAKLFDQRGYFPHAQIGITINCEQVPDPDNHVTLGQRQDVLGIPHSAIRWVPDAATGRTVRHFSMLLARQMAAAGIGTFVPAPWLEDDDAWRSALRDAYHPMGTARMAESPEQGVVDSDLRMFGLANGWIAGTSVFPTAGHSNPTFTAIALAIRLADRLKAA